MLDRRLIPTGLIDPLSRPPILIRDRESVSVSGPHSAAIVLRWSLACAWVVLRGRWSAAEAGRRVRELFERLGGVWVKLGQLLALRLDLFPYEFCRELATLQDSAFGFPGTVAASAVEQELGGSLDRFFDRFELHPFAAASIGQVHRARLRREGVWVAVKVQRPHIREAFRRQLRTVEFVIGWLQRIAFRPHMQWRDFFWELEEILREEVDYRFEATNAHRMRKTLRRHGVYVHHVFDAYCTERILVTEFIQGVLMADYIKSIVEYPAQTRMWLRHNNIDGRLVAERLSVSLLRQQLEDNLYHGDMHPGNIVLLRDSRVALLDFGAVSVTERGFLDRFRLSIQAMAAGDFVRAAELTLQLSSSLPAIDVESLKAEIVQSMRAWERRTFVRELPFHDKSVNTMYTELTRILYRYRCTMEWAFLRIRRAQDTLAASLMILFPGPNPSELSRRYLRRFRRRAAQRVLKPDTLAQVLFRVHAADEMLATAYDDALLRLGIIRRQARAFRRIRTAGADFLVKACGLLILLLIAGGLWLAAAWLDQHGAQWDGVPIRRIWRSGIDAVPRLDAQVWFLTTIAYAGALTAMLRLRGSLMRQGFKIPVIGVRV